MRRRRKVFPEKETGLTLVEVLLVLALLGMVVTAVYGFYFSGVVAWQKGVQQMDGQQNARIAMDRIIDDLRFAYSIDESVPGQVAFEVKGSSGALERYRIRLTNNEIVCEKLSESGVVQSHTKVAMGISALNFFKDSDKNVYITVVAGADADSNQVTMRSSVRPRNLP